MAIRCSEANSGAQAPHAIFDQWTGAIVRDQRGRPYVAMWNTDTEQHLIQTATAAIIQRMWPTIQTQSFIKSR